eukprot:3442591-Amphidinium_carterae.1
MSEGISGDLTKKLLIGDRYFVKYRGGSVVHERLALWPVDDRGWIVTTPDRDVYHEYTGPFDEEDGPAKVYAAGAMG